MGQLQIIASISVLLTVACTPSLAQAVQPPMSETTKEFDRMMAQSEQLHESAMPQPKEEKQSGEFLGTIPRFQEATANLRTAFGSQDDLKGHIRTLDKLIKPFTNYLKALKLKSKPINPADFKEYSQKDLEWETLTTAERIDNNLQRARVLLKDPSQTGSISIQAMEYLTGIHSDLTRLKWLTDKLTTPHPISR